MSFLFGFVVGLLFGTKIYKLQEGTIHCSFKEVDVVLLTIQERPPTRILPTNGQDSCGSR